MIRDYSILAGPLNQLLGNAPFEWGQQQQEAFEKLKEVLWSEPLIRPFDVKVPIVLITDASGTGWGAVLEQENQPVKYCSGPQREILATWVDKNLFFCILRIPRALGVGKNVGKIFRPSGNSVFEILIFYPLIVG